MVAIVVVFAVCCTVEPHLNGHHFLQTSVPEMKADHYGEEPSILLLKGLAVQRKVHCTILFVFVFRLWRPGFRGGRPKEGSLYCCYRPQQSCGQGNVFTGVCHSFCSKGGFSGDPPGRENPCPPEADSSIRSTSGRYASYWNAFLFVFVFTLWRPTFRWFRSLSATDSRGSFDKM